MDETELWPFKRANLWSQANDWRSRLRDADLCCEFYWHVPAKPCLTTLHANWWVLPHSILFLGHNQEQDNFHLFNCPYVQKEHVRKEVILYLISLFLSHLVIFLFSVSHSPSCEAQSFQFHEIADEFLVVIIRSVRVKLDLERRRTNWQKFPCPSQFPPLPYGCKYHSIPPSTPLILASPQLKGWLIKKIFKEWFPINNPSHHSSTVSPAVSELEQRVLRKPVC